MAMTAPSFYCFPELARKEAPGAPALERARPAFQRLAPGAPAGGACLRSSSGGGPLARPGKLRRAHDEDLEQAAYCRGYADGEKNGYEQGELAGSEAARKQLEPVLQSLQHGLAELESLRRREARAFEKELVELALGAARKIVGQEVAARPEVVAELLRDALQRIEHPGPLTIRMNPGDLERLADGHVQMLNGLGDSGRMRFEPDDSLSPGGCVIESEAGNIDARVEQRFCIVEDALMESGRLDAEVRGPNE
jgi:flagellar assembly protein FliH